MASTPAASAGPWPARSASATISPPCPASVPCVRCAPSSAGSGKEEGTAFQFIRLTAPPTREPGAPGEAARLRGLVRDLARLLAVCQDIIRHPDEAALLRTIAEQACRACNAERALVYVLEPGQERLQATALFGQGVVGFSVPIADDSIAGYVAKHNTFLNVMDTSEELTYLFPPLRLEADLRDRYGFEVRNVLAVPIHGQARAPSPEAGDLPPATDVVGVIEVLNKRGGPFGEGDEWFMAEMGLIAGLALQSARQRHQLMQMRRADRAKSRFVALLMHQIISPLATAYTCVSTLARLGERLSTPDREALAQGALAKVVSVQELSKKLLDLTAVQDGRALADCREVNILEVLRAEVESHRPSARERDIRLRARLPRRPVRVRADPTGLGIIFANLLENAIKYSDGGTEIVVTGRVDGGNFFATVRDHGPGIPEKDLRRLFEEFYRCADAAKRGIAGSGLGLTFVKTLLDRYGGSIHVDSQPGRGSRFTVSFPCA